MKKKQTIIIEIKIKISILDAIKMRIAGGKYCELFWRKMYLIEKKNKKG